VHSVINNLSQRTTSTPHRTPKRKREDPINLHDGSSDEVQREHISQVICCCTIVDVSSYCFKRTKTISASSDSDENHLNSIASLDDAVENVSILSVISYAYPFFCQWKPFKVKAFDDPVILPTHYFSRSLGTGISYETMNTRRQLASHRLKSCDHANLSGGAYIWTLVSDHPTSSFCIP
jgi:hypothetical protein